MRSKHVLEQQTLPRGWTKTTLGQTVTLSKKKIEPIDFNNRKYVGLEHIESNTGIITSCGNSGSVQSTKNVFAKGDILYGRLRPYLNKVCIPDFGGICSTDILVLKPHKFILPSFLYLCMRTIDFVQFATISSQGVNLPRVKFSTIESYQISLPPHNEQKRIVSKIDYIFAKINTAEIMLKAVQTLTKQLRLVVLQLAFEGRLVPQDPNDEPAEILKQIQYSINSKVDDVQQNLSKDWTNTTLENVVDILDDKRVPVNSKERAKRQGNVPYYGATGQVGHINDYIFDEELVLLGEDGAPFLEPLKNKAYLISGKSWVNNHAHVLRGTKVSNKFLCFFLNQVDYSRFVSGTTRWKINQSALKTIPIRVPSMSEQRRIVSKIESIFSYTDTVDAHVTKLLSTLATLRKSSLKLAFEGRLVSQNPRDEPAHMLLERTGGGKHA